MTDFIQESDKVARNLKSYTSVLFVNEKEYTTKNIDLDVEVNFEYLILYMRKLAEEKS